MASDKVAEVNEARRERNKLSMQNAKLTTEVAIRPHAVSKSSASGEGFLVNTRRVAVSNSETNISAICNTQQTYKSRQQNYNETKYTPTKYKKKYYTAPVTDLVFQLRR